MILNACHKARHGHEKGPLRLLIRPFRSGFPAGEKERGGNDRFKAAACPHLRAPPTTPAFNN